MYEELLRVPLIIIPPGGLKEGVRITAPVSLLDVYPTLCELYGVPITGGVPVKLSPALGDLFSQVQFDFAVNSLGGESARW